MKSFSILVTNVRRLMKFGQVIGLLELLKRGTSSTHKAARIWRSELKLWKSKTRCTGRYIRSTNTGLQRLLLLMGFTVSSARARTLGIEYDCQLYLRAFRLAGYSDVARWTTILLTTVTHTLVMVTNLFGTNIEKYNVLVNGATYSNADNHWSVKPTISYPVTSHLHRFTSDYSATLLDTDWRQAASTWHSPRNCTDWSTPG
jgi:hypothetical protein